MTRHPSYLWSVGDAVEKGSVPVACMSSMLLGDVVFETLALNAHGTPLFWAEHMQRWMDGLIRLGVDKNDAAVRCTSLTDQILAENVAVRARANVSDDQVGVLRWIACADGAVGVGLQYQAKRAHRGSVGLLKDIRFRDRAAVKQPHYGAVLSTFRVAQKTMPPILDAIFVREQLVLDALFANVFIYKDGWWTPPVSAGVRDGVTRAWLLRTAKEWGIACGERDLEVDDLKTAECVVLTSSVRGLFEVSALVQEKDTYAFSNASEAWGDMRRAWEQVSDHVAV